MNTDASAAWRPVAFLAALCSTLSGCATAVSEQMTTLQAAPICCKSMTEFKYTRLSSEEDREVKLTSESPAFVFGGIKSYFSAYRLPAWRGPLQIRAVGKATGSKDGLFGPSAVMLDRHFQPTRRFDVGDRARPEVLHIFVNEGNRGEEYIVLYTGRLGTEGIEELVARPTTVAVGTVPLMIGATESKVFLQYAPTGVMQLTVSRYRPMRPDEFQTRSR